MSKINDLLKSLPPREIPFTVNLEGSISGAKYEGSFTVRVPLVQDMSRIGVELARINNGVPHEDLDLGTAMLNNALAYLKVLLTDAPEWFTSRQGMDFGNNTFDSNVVIEIFQQAEQKVADWKKAVKGDKSEPKSEKA